MFPRDPPTWTVPKWKWIEVYFTNAVKELRYGCKGERLCMKSPRNSPRMESKPQHGGGSERGANQIDTDTSNVHTLPTLFLCRWIFVCHGKVVEVYSRATRHVVCTLEHHSARITGVCLSSCNPMQVRHSCTRSLVCPT